MRDDGVFSGRLPGYRVVIATLDSHAAGPARRAADVLVDDYPGLDISIHAAAEWGETPGTFEAAEAAVMSGDIIISNLLFLEEHVARILPALQARRDECDAMFGVIADAEIAKLTRMGSLDMTAPQSGAMTLMKRLRGSSKPSSSSGADKMRMLRRLPKILRFIPGKAQDLRAWFLIMQYWLGGSNDNVEAMIRFLLNRYALTLARILKTHVQIHSIYGRHFAAVPKHASSRQVTKLEEDRICAYYAGGKLYADERRQEPKL